MAETVKIAVIPYWTSEFVKSKGYDVYRLLNQPDLLKEVLSSEARCELALYSDWLLNNPLYSGIAGVSPFQFENKQNIAIHLVTMRSLGESIEDLSMFHSQDAFSMSCSVAKDGVILMEVFNTPSTVKSRALTALQFWKCLERCGLTFDQIMTKPRLDAFLHNSCLTPDDLCTD